MISVIMPTYNRQELCKLRILEFLAQDYNGESELIIINDGSSENYNNIEEMSDNKKIRYIKLNQNSSSVSIPRNIGIANAHGEFICNFDDDVEQFKNKLSVLINTIEEDSLISCGARCHQDIRTNINKIYIPVDKNYNPKNGPGIDNGQILYRKSVYQKIPLKFPKRACDWELIKRIWEINPKISYSDVPVCNYIWHESNRSHDNNTKTKTIFPINYKNYFNKYEYQVDYDEL